MAITLEQAQAQLDAYLAAEIAVLSGQSYEIAGRKWTRADLTAIQRGIQLWSDKVAGFAAGGLRAARARTIVPGW